MTSADLMVRRLGQAMDDPVDGPRITRALDVAIAAERATRFRRLSQRQAAELEEAYLDSFEVVLNMLVEFEQRQRPIVRFVRWLRGGT